MRRFVVLGRNLIFNNHKFIVQPYFFNIPLIINANKIFLFSFWQSFNFLLIFFNDKWSSLSGPDTIFPVCRPRRKIPTIKLYLNRCKLINN